MHDMCFPEIHKKQKQRRAFTINNSTHRILTYISTDQHQEEDALLGLSSITDFAVRGEELWKSTYNWHRERRWERMSEKSYQVWLQAKGVQSWNSLAQLHPFIHRHLPFWVLLCTRRSYREKGRHQPLYLKIIYPANSFTSWLSLTVNSFVQKVFY